MKIPGLHSRVLILGAGPAGLTAAYELCRTNIPSIILEQDSVVGGLARTVNHNGYLFDIGGHRFYTKVPLIEQIWKDVLGDDLLVRPRLSRIYYHGKFFQYPLEAMDTLAGLGVLETARCLASYVKARFAPKSPEDNFEAWVSNRFGSRLFKIFFKEYTEKVWGIPCDRIRSDWAAQRIRGLSMAALIRAALSNGRGKGTGIKTLIRDFYYPRQGPGMMWSRMRALIEAQGARVDLNSPVEQVLHDGTRITGVRSSGRTYTAEHFISSIPIRDLIQRLSPSAPELEQAANGLHYRDFITVALMVRGSNLFRDNWIYVHDPAVKVGRIQNYNNWSPEMTPKAGTSCLGLEYFCQQDDGLWNKSDADLVAQAVAELSHLGLATSEAIIDSAVVRVPKAYPVYDGSYQSRLNVVRKFVDSVPNLQLVGRNGMHRYNNQDHAMLTGILAARNIMGACNNLWELDIDSGYLEENSGLAPEDLAALESTQPRTPRAVSVA